MRRSNWINAIAMGVLIVASMTLGGVLAVNVGGDSEDAAPRAALATATAPRPTAAATPSSTPAPTATATATVATTEPTATATAQPAATVEAAATSEPATEQTAALPDLPDLVERVMPSIVQIRVDRTGTGSGIVIDRQRTHPHEPACGGGSNAARRRVA